LKRGKSRSCVCDRQRGSGGATSFRYVWSCLNCLELRYLLLVFHLTPQSAGCSVGVSGREHTHNGSHHRFWLLSRGSHHEVVALATGDVLSAVSMPAQVYEAVPKSMLERLLELPVGGRATQATECQARVGELPSQAAIEGDVRVVCGRVRVVAHVRDRLSR
jgi:hypothetical protein